MIHMCGPRNPHKDAINVTSRSAEGRGLSPFLLGPVKLYGDYTAKNVENGWQFSKVYEHHIKEDGEPHEAYFQWATKGWSSLKAFRYPMGKGVYPAYSYWDGQKLTYVEARKKIYAPLYAGAVEHTDAFKKLKETYEREKEIWLWDFDGYDHLALNMTYTDVMNCDARKMGHCFVLGMLLQNERVWE